MAIQKYIILDDQKVQQIDNLSRNPNTRAHVLTPRNIATNKWILPYAVLDSNLFTAYKNVLKSLPTEDIDDIVLFQPKP